MQKKEPGFSWDQVGKREGSNQFSLDDWPADVEIFRLLDEHRKAHNLTDDEPDFARWTSAGHPCAAARNNGGAWCGYVCVDEAMLEDITQGLAFDDVDGGCTWDGSGLYGVREKEGYAWVGFDCAHARQRSPWHEVAFAAQGWERNAFGERYESGVYVTFQDVVIQTEEIAARICAAMIAARICAAMHGEVEI